MRRLIAIASAVSALALCPVAAHAAVVVNGPIRPGQVLNPSPGQTMDFFVSTGPSGTISGTFGDTGIPTGAFQDLYNFIIPASGTGSGSVITTVDLSGLNGPADLDIYSVLVNGLSATPVYRDGSNAICTTPGVGSCGITESFAINNVPITAGAPNVITVNGLSRGNGSYGGNATFIPAGAVPEPATWAMMLLGFGAIGFSLRSRRRHPVLAQLA